MRANDERLAKRYADVWLDRPVTKFMIVRANSIRVFEVGQGTVLTRVRLNGKKNRDLMLDLALAH